jgi:hypothetical protein
MLIIPGIHVPSEGFLLYYVVIFCLVITFRNDSVMELDNTEHLRGYELQIGD